MLSIEELLTHPEGRTLEFKKDLSSFKPILRTLVAFANTAGGTLIIGVSDDGEVLGVENIFAAEEKLANIIADSIAPSLVPEIEIASAHGLSLLVARVPYWRGPFYLKEEGNNRGVYIRLGSTNRVPDEVFLSELKRSLTRESFDQMPCPQEDYSSLDKERIDRAFSQIGKKVSKKALESLGILVPYHNTLVCSKGGIILFGKDEIRRRYFPNAEVRCARFQGENKSQFIDRYDFEGTIIEAMEEVPKFIQRNTRLAAEIESIRRRDIPEYSPVVIREVLANALVHGDYNLIGMNPRVAIFSDRLEIESPGMVPFGYALEDFFTGVSHIRNKVIARVFRELNIIEEWGTGYKRIAEVSHEEDYPIPDWKEFGVCLRVILSPHTATLETPRERFLFKEERGLTPRQEEIYLILEKRKVMTTKEIHTLLSFSISERTLRNDLSLMQRQGYVKMVGQGPAAHWKIC